MDGNVTRHRGIASGSCFHCHIIDKCSSFGHRSSHLRVSGSVRLLAGSLVFLGTSMGKGANRIAVATLSSTAIAKKTTCLTVSKRHSNVLILSNANRIGLNGTLHRKTPTDTTTAVRN